MCIVQTTLRWPGTHTHARTVTATSSASVSCLCWPIWFPSSSASSSTLAHNYVHLFVCTMNSDVGIVVRMYFRCTRQNTFHQRRTDLRYIYFVGNGCAVVVNVFSFTHTHRTCQQQDANDSRSEEEEEEAEMSWSRRKEKQRGRRGRRRCMGIVYCCYYYGFFFIRSQLSANTFFSVFL